jgi:hypothetical protein
VLQVLDVFLLALCCLSVFLNPLCFNHISFLLGGGVGGTPETRFLAIKFLGMSGEMHQKYEKVSKSCLHHKLPSKIHQNPIRASFFCFRDRQPLFQISLKHSLSLISFCESSRTLSVFFISKSLPCQPNCLRF